MAIAKMLGHKNLACTAQVHAQALDVTLQAAFDHFDAFVSNDKKWRH